MKKIGKTITIIMLIVISIMINQVKTETIQIQTKSIKNLNAEEICQKEFKTNSSKNIQIFFQENQVVSDRDLIFYIRTDKSIKGRKVNIVEQSNKREPKSEVAFINEDEQYCYQYTFLTYKGNKVESIIIEDLPEEDVTFYAWVKYNSEQIEVDRVIDLDTNEELGISEDKKLIPTSYLSDEEISKLKSEDVKIMKEKWATKLGIDISQVDDYIDQYNAKGLGKLHKDGKKIKNADGEEVMINAVGLFHILDYGYMYNEETLHALKYWGINCIRIPAYIQFRQSNLSDTVTKVERGLETAYEEHIEEMDRIIDIATKEGLYCMVDFHILSENGDITKWTETAKKFFTHFAEKYGKQNNIFYELANEPFSTSNENLLKYINEIIPIIKKYDNNPILILGANDGVRKIEELKSCYEYIIKANNNDDIFISHHYYNGADYDECKELYETTDIPLIFTEWGNSDADTNSMSNQYTQITKQYMKWWNDKNIINSVWMLCHGNYTYSLWNTQLGKQSEILQYGVISEKYLSDYGKLVFETYLENTLNRIDVNKVAENQENKSDTEQVGKDTEKIDDTTAKQIIPNTGKKGIFVIVILSLIVLIIGYKLKNIDK